MEIKGEGYQIKYDPATVTVFFKGTLRLMGMAEYDHIEQLLAKVAATEPDTIILDLHQLKFLSSSGFNVLSKFIVKVCNHSATKLLVRSVGNVPWQRHSFRSLQRLIPHLEIEWE